jgi:type IV pilus assembly protein PilB
VYEVLIADAELRRMVARDAMADTIRDWIREAGLPTLLDGGLDLATREVTSLEEVARVTLFD